MSSYRVLLALLAFGLGLVACQRPKPTQIVPPDLPSLPASPTVTPLGQPSPTPTLVIWPSLTPAQRVHWVIFGENLSSIALLYGVSEEAIAQANKLVPPYLIFVGQELVIPVAEATPSPTAPPSPTPTKSGLLIHVVQPGENLFRISLRYGVTVEAIKAANALASDIIYVGQELIIPLP